MSRLFEQYNSEIKKSMQEKFQYGNVMEIPKLEKIVINIGVGDAVGNAKALEAAVNDLTIIAGQKPVITKAKKSIANFKVREGMALGTKVTLRGERTLRVLLSPEALQLVHMVSNKDENSPYLFPILRSKDGTEAAYKEYQSALRRFNYQLSALKTHLNMSSHLSSYSARHTWATMAYYCEIHPGIISEAMGHSSITVTETYLKPFQNKKIDEANKRVIDFIRYSVRNAIC